MKRYGTKGRKLELRRQSVANLSGATGGNVTDPGDGTGDSCACPSLITCYLYCLTASDQWVC